MTTSTNKEDTLNAPRIASLFTGTGALDLAVMDVFGGETVWHSQYEPPDKKGKPDTNQYAAKILARHWPNVPNLGDITAINWAAVRAEHGPIDILTGGFPCQDVSSAGKRSGLTDDSRSGLWAHMARAIAELEPELVVIENVEGLLSAKAAGDLEPCPYCVGDRHDQPLLRALGAVLGDLAVLGFDAEWARVAASEVGAAHGRKRVFIYAWPSAAVRERAALQDTHVQSRGQWRFAASGQAEGGRARSDAGGRGGALAADAGRPRLEVGGVEPDGSELPATERGGGEPAADPQGAGLQGLRPEPAGRGPERGRAVAADPDSLGRWNRPRLIGRVGPTGRSAEAHAAAFQQRADVLNLRPGPPDIDWGDYGPAIRRWEAILGRPAPWPTDALGRLSPVFTEWLMGLPDGWVTCTPGLTRSAMLRALGNGVVRQQAVAALHLLAGRATSTAAAA
ncbi:DNA cytosine methyltransferase [Streptomyces parvus]|uniref:DNA cytosine methyltransferase n=1 Tax=Streptomyces parvus TaxID=66428 RepID=UPI0021015F0E|nr:DNA cytosine methyltransferase [Streptomyces parvus]MCQ1575443.1 DNA cytosine methyltransferase [Streptomyces parvus]